MAITGNLIIFEGPDGAGKTTLAYHLNAHLREYGVACEYMSFPGREPGTLGGLVYGLHHEPQTYGISSITPASLQVLHIAAHVDAIANRIRPALQAGITIVLDRFWWSTWVYGQASGVSEAALKGMLAVELDAWGDIVPSVAFLIDGVAAKRQNASGVNWDMHAALYRELAQKEGHSYPVKSVSNEGAVDESLEQVYNALQGIVADCGQTADGKPCPS